MPARRRGRHGAESPSLLIPARGVRPLDRFLHFRAVEAGKPFGGEIDHGGFALRGQFAAERAGHFDQAKVRAGDIGENRCSVRIGRFLEHQIVALEAERIAGEFERDVVVAAERQLGECVEMPFRKFRREFDRARRDHIGRHRDDGGPRGDRAPFGVSTVISRRVSITVAGCR